MVGAKGRTDGQVPPEPAINGTGPESFQPAWRRWFGACAQDRPGFHKREAAVIHSGTRSYLPSPFEEGTRLDVAGAEN